MVQSIEASTEPSERDDAGHNLTGLKVPRDGGRAPRRGQILRSAPVSMRDLVQATPAPLTTANAANDGRLRDQGDSTER